MRLISLTFLVLSIAACQAKDWPQELSDAGYPPSSYNLAHEDELLAKVSAKARSDSFKPSFVTEGLLPLMFLAGIFLGIAARSAGISFVCAGLYLGQILWECNVYGDKVLGAFLSYSLMCGFVGICFMAVSFVFLGGAKLLGNAFQPESPRGKRRPGQKFKRSGQRKYRG